MFVVIIDGASSGNEASRLPVHGERPYGQEQGILLAVRSFVIVQNRFFLWIWSRKIVWQLCLRYAKTDTEDAIVR